MTKASRHSAVPVSFDLLAVFEHRSAFFIETLFFTWLLHVPHFLLPHWPLLLSLLCWSLFSYRSPKVGVPQGSDFEPFLADFNES